MALDKNNILNPEEFLYNLEGILENNNRTLKMSEGEEGSIYIRTLISNIIENIKQGHIKIVKGG